MLFKANTLSVYITDKMSVVSAGPRSQASVPLGFGVYQYQQQQQLQHTRAAFEHSSPPAFQESFESCQEEYIMTQEETSKATTFCDEEDDSTSGSGTLFIHSHVDIREF